MEMVGKTTYSNFFIVSRKFEKIEICLKLFCDFRSEISNLLQTKCAVLINNFLENLKKILKNLICANFYAKKKIGKFCIF